LDSCGFSGLAHHIVGCGHFLGDEPAAKVIKAQPDGATLDSHRLVKRTRMNDIASIGFGERDLGEAFTCDLFALRMDVLGLAGVDEHRHAGVGHGQRLRLCLAQLRPRALARLIHLREVVGELAEVEGKIALLPVLAPVFD
jgi:hypothetical protein